MDLSAEDRQRLAQVRASHPELATFVDELRTEMGGKVVWVQMGDWEVGQRGPEGVVLAEDLPAVVDNGKQGSR